MNNLNQLAKKILLANPDGMLSGSFALELQGIKLRREVKDLDIWIPGRAIQIEGMMGFSGGDEDNRYPDDFFSKETFMVEGIRVDFFTPIEHPEIVPAWKFECGLSGLKVLLPEEIMKFKLGFAFDESYQSGQKKHIKDLLFILTNRLKNITENPFDQF